jgi:hexosaminidase
MWSELTNKHTFEPKVTQRSSVIAERLWNVNVDINSEINNIAKRLTAHSQRLRDRGFKVWPVTVGLCEQDMDICF